MANYSIIKFLDSLKQDKKDYDSIEYLTTKRKTFEEIIVNETKLAQDFQKVIDTHMTSHNVSLEEMYCDDTEVIEEQLQRCKVFADYHNQIANTMRKYQKIINDYEALSDSLEKSGASPKVCTKKIDEFCIDTMKGILCDYYADVLHEEIEDGKKNN